MKRIKITKDTEIYGLCYEEIAFIAKYYGIIPAKVIAEILGIPQYKVYKVARKLGLVHNMRGYPKHLKIRINGETDINHGNKD